MKIYVFFCLSDRYCENVGLCVKNVVEGTKAFKTCTIVDINCTKSQVFVRTFQLAHING